MKPIDYHQEGLKAKRSGMFSSASEAMRALDERRKKERSQEKLKNKRIERVLTLHFDRT